jgi:hypothetical protein
VASLGIGTQSRRKLVAINLTLFPTEAPAVIYFADGTSTSVPPQQEGSLQIPDGGFCTISSTVSYDEDEHMMPEERAVEFAEKMIAFWVGLADKARAAAPAPAATPL